MGLRGDGESAVAHLVSFVVAGVVFLVAVGAIVLTTGFAGGDTEPVDYAGQDARTESLADLLIESPGVGWSQGDHPVRLGLQADNGSGLDSARLAVLRGALESSSSSNGKVDYAEALDSLGIEDGDFHVRIYPVGLQPSLLQADLSGIRTAYIGDWSSLASVTVSLGSPDAMKSTAQAQFDLQMSSYTSQERDALDALGLGFNNGIYIGAAGPTVLVPDLLHPTLLSYLNVALIEGDVYPDSKTYLDDVLPGRLPQYELLVVGGGVDQSTLTSSATKNAIRDFVLDGGILFVFGSDKQNFQWLQPLFSLGVSTVNGAAFAPDVTHPVLHEPNALGWTSYSDHGQAWDIKDTGSGAHYKDFSHVIVKGGEDVLAISNVGAFGDGRVFLSTYRPGEIADSQGLAEAASLMQNFVLFADRSHLYLDYGAEIPVDAEVAAAVRESHVWDETLGQVPVRIEVHYW